MNAPLKSLGGASFSGLKALFLANSQSIFEQEEKAPHLNFKSHMDNKQIGLNGEATSLSTFAQKLLDYSYNVQGTIYWMCEGETLDERHNRLEREE